MVRFGVNEPMINVDDEMHAFGSLRRLAFSDLADQLRERFRLRGKFRVGKTSAGFEPLIDAFERTKMELGLEIMRNYENYPKVCCHFENLPPPQNERTQLLLSRTPTRIEQRSSFN